jgi:hypothetical protein
MASNNSTSFLLFKTCFSIPGFRPEQNSRHMFYRGARSDHQSGPALTIKAAQLQYRSGQFRVAKSRSAAKASASWESHDLRAKLGRYKILFPRKPQKRKGHELGRSPNRLHIPAYSWLLSPLSAFHNPLKAFGLSWAAWHGARTAFPLADQVSRRLNRNGHGGWVCARRFGVSPKVRCPCKLLIINNLSAWRYPFART